MTFDSFVFECVERHLGCFLFFYKSGWRHAIVTIVVYLSLRDIWYCCFEHRQYCDMVLLASNIISWAYWITMTYNTIQLRIHTNNTKLCVSGSTTKITIISTTDMWHASVFVYINNIVFAAIRYIWVLVNEVHRATSYLRGLGGTNVVPNGVHAWQTGGLYNVFPDSKVHGAYMGPTWVLSAPDGPHELCYLGCFQKFIK